MRGQSTSWSVENRTVAGWTGKQEVGNLKAMQIDWSSDECHFLRNSKLSDEQVHRLSEVQESLPDLPGHIWILTSGSSSLHDLKWVALSKQAFLCSAKSVNEHLKVSVDDTWLLTLPLFHVGGLSILARAHLSKSKVHELLGDWSAPAFFELVEREGITLTSLVPTQLFDLVALGKVCLPSLRAIVIGGGALSKDLYFRARALGYPVLPSYGMTECCSQIATADLNSLEKDEFPEMKLLPHVEMRSNPDGLIEIKSKALLTGMALIGPRSFQYVDPKTDDWYKSEDLGFVENSFVHVLGRKKDQVKVLGELVLLPRLQQILERLQPESFVVAVPDEREGHCLAAVFLKEHLGGHFLQTVKEFNSQVAPYERLKQIYFVNQIPRTELGKLRKAALDDILGLH